MAASQALQSTGLRAAAASAACPWVGSLDPVPTRFSQLLGRMTQAQQLSMVAGISTAYVGSTPAIPALCIPALTLEDGPAGVGAGKTGMTQLPAPASAAATFDPAARLPPRREQPRRPRPHRHLRRRQSHRRRERRPRRHHRDHLRLTTNPLTLHIKRAPPRCGGALFAPEHPHPQRRLHPHPERRSTGDQPTISHCQTRTMRDRHNGGVAERAPRPTALTCRSRNPCPRASVARHSGAGRRG
jgi:hypothetical protein